MARFGYCLLRANVQLVVVHRHDLQGKFFNSSTSELFSLATASPAWASGLQWRILRVAGRTGCSLWRKPPTQLIM